MRWWLWSLMLLQGCIEITVVDPPDLGEATKAILYIARDQGTCEEPDGSVVHREVRSVDAPSTTIETTGPTVTYAVLFDEESDEIDPTPTCVSSTPTALFCSFGGAPFHRVERVSLSDVLGVPKCNRCPPVAPRREVVLLGDLGRPRGAARWTDQTLFATTANEAFWLAETATTAAFRFITESWLASEDEILLGGAVGGRPTIRRLVPPSLDYTDEVVADLEARVRSLARDGARLFALVSYDTKPEALVLYAKEDGSWSQLALTEFDEVPNEDVEVAFAPDGEILVAAAKDLYTPTGNGRTFRPITVEYSLPPYTFVYSSRDEVLLGAGTPGRLFLRKDGESSFRSTDVEVPETVDAVTAYRGGYLIGSGTWLGYVRFDDPPIVCPLSTSGARVHSISIVKEGVLVGGRYDLESAFFWYDHFGTE